MKTRRRIANQRKHQPQLRPEYRSPAGTPNLIAVPHLRRCERGHSSAGEFRTNKSLFCPWNPKKHKKIKMSKTAFLALALRTRRTPFKNLIKNKNGSYCALLFSETSSILFLSPLQLALLGRLSEGRSAQNADQAMNHVSPPSDMSAARARLAAVVSGRGKCEREAGIG